MFDHSAGEWYAYDEVGNRTAYTVTTALAGTTVTTYTYDSANRLTKVGDVAYTWDARGNLTNDGVFTYTYNAAGRMVRAESVTSTLLYTYTADGLRVAQSVRSVPESVDSFAWDTASALPQALATSAGALYLYGLDLVAQQQSDAWQYPLVDSLGSIRQWTDDAGSVTYAAGYTPFGEELWRAGSAASAWGYTGEWQDAAVGLVYLRARWYDGATGRFTQRDPLVTSSFYRYASNNPVNRVDPSGYIDWEHGCGPFDSEYGVCIIEEGDRLFQISREINATGLGFADLNWTTNYIVALNEIPNRDLIYTGQEIKLPQQWINALRSSPPLGDTEKPFWDTMSGYLEGRMIYGVALGCLYTHVKGIELVYDFAVKPPVRAAFVYEGLGLGVSLGLGGDDDSIPGWEVGEIGYGGYIWAFHPKRSIKDDYQGPAVSASGGLAITLNIPIPPEWKGKLTGGVSFGGGAGLSASLSPYMVKGASPIWVANWYDTGSLTVGSGNPALGASVNLSVIGANFTMIPGSEEHTIFGDEHSPDWVGLKNEITTGGGWAFYGLDFPHPFVAGLRPYVAEHIYNVATDYHLYRE